MKPISNTDSFGGDYEQSGRDCIKDNLEHHNVFYCGYLGLQGKEEHYKLQASYNSTSKNGQLKIVKKQDKKIYVRNKENGQEISNIDGNALTTFQDKNKIQHGDSIPASIE